MMMQMRFGKQMAAPKQLEQIPERERGAKGASGAKSRRERLTTHDGLTPDVNSNDAKLAKIAVCLARSDTAAQSALGRPS